MSHIVEFFDFMESRFITGSISLVVHIINFLVIIVFFYLKYKKNEKNKELNYQIFDYTVMTITASGIGSIVLIVLGNKAIIFSHVLGVYISIFTYRKYLYDGQKVTIEREILDDESDNDDDMAHARLGITISEDTNISNLDILDVLEIYGYISHKQRIKLVSSSIFEHSSDMALKLLNMAVLEEGELNEAIATYNLIKLRNRLVSEEEVQEFIDEYYNCK